MRNWISIFLLTVVMGLPIRADPSADTCGSAEIPCIVSTGDYHVLLPQTDAPKGIVMHLHGGGGTGKGLLKSGMARAAQARNYLFVAPTGYHPNARYKRNWSVRAGQMRFERDDIGFLKEVLSDVRARPGMDSAPVLLSGFSRGGSMVWDTACADPEFADAYAPMAGAFWDDLPTSCAGPVKLFHTHGWNDRTVPLEGRSFADGAIVQGDVWASLKILRETNGCRNRQPESSSYEDGYWMRHWTDCASGQIDLLLHQGGHGAPKGWSERVLDWFED